MEFILPDVCLKCLPKIYSMGNCKQLLDVVIRSIPQEAKVIYKSTDFVRHSVKRLEDAGYVVSTEIDKDRMCVNVNLRNVRVKQGWICFGIHKKIGAIKDR
jgi:hypothetical protein